MGQQVKREVEITLHSIHIPVTGAGLDTTTSHLLTADLVWPRTGTARKSASQSCTLREGAAEFAAANWGRRILFKETVEGRFALAVTVTESLDDEELEKILRFWAGAALAVGAGAVDGVAVARATARLVRATVVDVDSHAPPPGHPPTLGGFMGI